MARPRAIILLCPHETAADLSAFVRRSNADVGVSRVEDIEVLRDRVAACDGRARLISFLSDLIIPGDVLRSLTLTPYNIHGGPPEYPGSHANSFAILEGASAFGATAHEITPRVDEGAIVAVARFDMPERPTRLGVADLAFEKAVGLFAMVASHCARSDEDLPRLDCRWGDRKTTKAAFRSLCERPAGDDAEADLLRRVCGPDWLGRRVA
ncbi:MAG: formyltransferase family protein [Pseudomonadota bacterium]